VAHAEAVFSIERVDFVVIDSARDRRLRHGRSRMVGRGRNEKPSSWTRCGAINLKRS